MPFPSFLVPLLQSESQCETILMKMTLIYTEMKLHAELIFISKVSHLDSRHKRTRKWHIVSSNIWTQLGLRGAMCFFSVDFFVQQKEMWTMIQYGLTSTDHPVGGMEEPLRGKFKAILLSIF